MEENPVSTLVTRLGPQMVRRILDDQGALGDWLSGKRPVPPLTHKRARVANQMCGVLGGLLDRDELRDWWRAKTSTFGGTPADAVSRARRDEEFDALLDAADRFGAREQELWQLHDKPPPLPRSERREQDDLERKPTNAIDRGKARRVKIDDDLPPRR